ncbi:hypothetical protein [Xanthomonas citri]|uniref:hypothetical protein n=1 Tax=Xanthomonas citri TaxID=346 RepID=UPI000CCF6EDD|nr:hypothetical protein [Xanthomonas citri]PNV26808.1 hypothetical protein xavtCFBP7764_21630 [Xanthomonas citri]
MRSDAFRALIPHLALLVALLVALGVATLHVRLILQHAGFDGDLTSANLLLGADVMRIRDATQDPKLKTDLESATDSWQHRMNVIADDRDAISAHKKMLGLLGVLGALWFFCLTLWFVNFVSYSGVQLIHVSRWRRRAVAEGDK